MLAIAGNYLATGGAAVRTRGSTVQQYPVLTIIIPVPGTAINLLIGVGTNLEEGKIEVMQQ